MKDTAAMLAMNGVAIVTYKTAIRAFVIDFLVRLNDSA